MNSFCQVIKFCSHQSRTSSSRISPGGRSCPRTPTWRHCGSRRSDDAWAGPDTPPGPPTDPGTQGATSRREGGTPTTRMRSLADP